MKTINARQTGITAIGITAILLMIGFLTLIGLKLFPVYYESFKVGSILQTLSEQENSNSLSAKEIKDTLLKRFRIDNVDYVKRNHISIKKEKKMLTVTIIYDVNQDFIGNIDFVVHINKKVKLKIK